MSKSKDGRMDPRVIRTRRMFKEAFVSLLETDFDQSRLTIQKLSDQAELNRATFYLHYQDIEDMKEQIATEMLEQLQEKIQPLLEDQAVADQPIISFLDHIYDNAALFNIMLEDNHFRKKLFFMISEVVSDRRQTRQSITERRKVPAEIIAASTFGIILWWIGAGTPYSSRHLAKQINLVFSNENN